MASDQAQFKLMYTDTRNKNMDLWLYNTVNKNVLSPLPFEIWAHIVSFLPRDPRTNCFKFVLRRWLYDNDDGSIPVHPGKIYEKLNEE